jgi:hypothetical protein
MLIGRHGLIDNLVQKSVYKPTLVSHHSAEILGANMHLAKRDRAAECSTIFDRLRRATTMI